jgi:hypothetical protein
VLAAPQLGVTGDLVEQRVALPGAKREGGLEDHPARIALEAARAVAECEIGGPREVLVAVGQHAGAHEGVADCASVGAGVADHGAAHRPRDVAGELQAGQAALRKVEDDVGQHRAGAGGQELAVEACVAIAGQHDKTPDAAIADQNVGRLAQDRDRQIELAAHDDRVPQGLGPRRRVQVLGRSAHPVGAVRPDRHVALQTRQLAFEDLADAGVGAVVHRSFPTIAASGDYDTRGP